MRLLANENMPGSVVTRLRQNGHDVLAVKESLRGAKDIDILARAQAESRVLIYECECGTTRRSNVQPVLSCERPIQLFDDRMQIAWQRRLARRCDCGIG